MRIQPHILEMIRRHQSNPPVKVGAIAQELGIKVLLSALPHKVSGKLERDGENSNKWIIRINRDEHRNRQRFTIAHELAHFLLHRNEIGDGITDDVFYRSTLSDAREREANQLAADILMPWPLITKMAEQGMRAPTDLATAFNVSEVAMKVRLGLPT